MISINLYGAPSSGKSTMAAFLFYYLKTKHCSVELCREYAKDIIYEGSLLKFRNQPHVTIEQYKRMKDIATNDKENVKLIVTDSPLLLGKIYTKERGTQSDTFCKLIDELNAEFENFNVYINRVNEYDVRGRIHTEEESNALALKIKKLVDFDLEINSNQEGQMLLAETVYKKFKNRII